MSLSGILKQFFTYSYMEKSVAYDLDYLEARLLVCYFHSNKKKTQYS
jgi:hypothetical protein